MLRIRAVLGGRGTVRQRRDGRRCRAGAPVKVSRGGGHLVVNRDRGCGGELRRCGLALVDDVLLELALDDRVVGAAKQLTKATAVLLEPAPRLIILFLRELEA